MKLKQYLELLHKKYFYFDRVLLRKLQMQAVKFFKTAVGITNAALVDRINNDKIQEI